ncbi:hypothetical protein [Terribacillus saccharophilus]|jgi:hypothetical protein|uniref:hypothetical protein n=1 Tax=Terribacillus saccharophilus TaxID=361277 RepID=UPI000BA618C2|nr:hypothetical protein [Terribacillus saccharophilus]PAF19770.1 hypothetical protein CHH51_01525 [Terribacillus saccharophilus]
MRTHSMTIGEFMDRKPVVKKNRAKKLAKVAAPVVVPFTFVTHAHAEESVVANGITSHIADTTLNTLAHALDPVVEILIALSFPVASVMVLANCFYFMFGQGDKAWSRIQGVGLGYCLIRMLPLFLEILKSVGDSIA